MRTTPPNLAPRRRGALVLAAALVLVGFVAALPQAAATVADETCNGLVSTNCNDCTVWVAGFCYIDINELKTEA